MGFKELPESAKVSARDTLSAILATSAKLDLQKSREIGRAVAEAFCVMEHHDDAPDTCGD